MKKQTRSNGVARRDEKKTVALSAVAGGAAVLAILALVWYLASSSGKRTEAAAAAPAPQAVATPAPLPEEPPADPAAEAAVKRVSIAELRDGLEKGTAVLIDVRDIDSYVAAHIPGSLHIPVAYIPGEIPWMPRDKEIITYCT